MTPERLVKITSATLLGAAIELAEERQDQQRALVYASCDEADEYARGAADAWSEALELLRALNASVRRDVEVP